MAKFGWTCAVRNIFTKPSIDLALSTNIKSIGYESIYQTSYIYQNYI